jgi:hypothetical protein
VLTGTDLFQFYMPIYGHSIGLSASQSGIILSMVGVAAFIVRIGMPSLVRRTGEVVLLAYSLFLGAAAFVVFPFFNDVAVLTVFAFLLGLSLGCGQPLSTILIYANSPPRRTGEALGLPQRGLALSEGFQQAALFRELPAELQLRHDLAPKDPKGIGLAGPEFTGQAIDHAQGADMGTVVQLQGRPGIKADVRCGGHQWVVGEPGVGQRVGHLKQAVAQDGMATKRHIARGLGHAGQAEIRLEPLPIAVDQAHQRDGHAANQCCRGHQSVEFAFGSRVQNIETL